MYNDGGVTDNLWTGFYDAVEGAYEYPSAHQNLIVRFPTWYLSADDGDFTTDSVTITSEVCSTEDITIGNAPAQVFSATMLNPDGLMENCTWGDGAVYLGVVTAEAAADTHSGWVACVSFNSHDYGFTASGTAHYDSTSQAIGGEPKAIVVKQDGTAEFYTSTGAYKYDGGFSSITPDAFTAAKYSAYDEPLGIILDANNCPSIINNVSAGTKTTITYIPMGIFDFSNVDAFGITFNVEAYDAMAKLDADATEWVKSLDFTTPKTISDLITELSTELSLTPVVSAYAINTALSFSENPITAYSVTYRQIVRWIAEAIGCNARISRTGNLVFWIFGNSVATITPDTIISNTRTKNRYTVPQITEVVCYDTLGMQYASGTSGQTYYIAANPFFTTLDQAVTPLSNLLTLFTNRIPAYFPTTISVACADPRLDAGDWISVRPVGGASDGSDDFNIPVMQQGLSWNGTCKATYIATGRQTRAIPEDLIQNNLSTTVNGRKILNGVDAKRITVLDENEEILFNADTDTDEVQIAGFTVEDDKLEYTKTYPVVYPPGHDETFITEVSQDGFKTSLHTWDEDVHGTDYDYTKSSEITQGEMEFVVDDSNNPEGQVYSMTHLFGGFMQLAQERNGFDEMEIGGSRREIILNPELASPLRVGSSTIDSGHNYVGSEVWIAPTGITFSDGTTTPQFRIVQRVLTSAGTLTFSLNDGIYLCTVTRNNSNDSAQTGLYILQVRASGNSSCLPVVSASDTTLSVSGGTLTWTTTTTYKTLTILRITG